MAKNNERVPDKCWCGRASSLVLALWFAAGPAMGNPGGGTVVGGQATIAESGSTLTVTQDSDRAIINWDSFSIGADQTTRFVQPSSRAIAANRVTGVDPSQILGSLQANGQVVLINRNGILFGKGATVDAAGLIATVHDLDNAAFMAGGPIRFDENGTTDASIVNEGTITIREAGLAAFVAPHVRNAGVIQADLGRVALASAKGFSVDLYGDGLLSFAPGDALDATLGDGSRALVEQSGEIHAAGGKILLTAKAAEAVVNASVNVSGVVQASSVSRSGGVIRLEGPGQVRVEETGKVVASGATGGGHIAIEAGSFSTEGTIEAEGVDANGRAAKGGTVTVTADSVGLGGIVSASGKSGGRIDVESSGLLSLAGHNEARGLLGKGGDVSYESERIVESSTSSTDVSGLTDGGTIRVEAGSQLASSGEYRASGVYGRGGQIDLTAPDLRLLTASLSASGRQQGGLVRVGGAFQGGKTPDPGQPYYGSFVDRWSGLADLASAGETFVNDATVIDVSAWQGPGGTAVIWSDERTTFLGHIDARGTAGGGSVEISSAGDLRRAELTDVQLGNGHLLLDPKNIIIGQQATVQSWAYQGVLGVGYVNAQQNVHSELDDADHFGVALSLNAAGDRLAVGASTEDGANNAAPETGAVHLFSFTDTNFSGGMLESTIGAGYTGGKNVDVDGLDNDDQFGRAVSLNAVGDRLAVGAYSDDSAGAGSSTNNYGAVYLFTFADADFGGGALGATMGQGYTGGNNVHVAGLEANDNFGVSVALNAAGDRLAVGSNGDDGAGNGTLTAGAVRLFTFTDTSFAGAARAAIIGAGYGGVNDINLPLDSNDSFGLSVSLNAAGDRLAAAAQGDDGAGVGANANNYGAVYLFTFANNDFESGVRAATIGEGYTGGNNVNIAATLDVDDQIGYGVSLNAAGDRLAVGAWNDDGAGAGSTTDNYGAVHLFTFDDNNFTGGALAGTIGRGYTGGNNVNLATLDLDDRFGVSVALNGAGDRLAGGAHVDDGAGNILDRSGAAHLFTFTDTNFSGGAHVGSIGAGYTARNDINVALDAADGFGTGVALNGAGDRLAVGAWGDQGADNLTNRAGAAYLFSFTDANFSGGALEAVIGKGYTGGKNVDVATLDAADLFGIGVSLNAAGDRLAVGAYQDDGAGVGSNANNYGAAYLFSFTDTNFSGGVLETTVGAGYTGDKDVDVALDAGDFFGVSVSLNGAGDRLAVGAYTDDGAGNGLANSGAAYLFSFTDTNFSGGALEATIGHGYGGGKDVGVTLEGGDQFGRGVALNAAGDRLAVGVPGDDGTTTTALTEGAVYLFSFTDTNFSDGVLAGKIGQGYTGGNNISVPLAAGEAMGRGVSLNAAGDQLAVASPGDNGASGTLAGSGAVYLFTFSDEDFSGGALAGTIGRGYTGGKNIHVPSVDTGDNFGTEVSLNAAGDRLAVGAYSDDGAGVGSTADAVGAVYLFSFTDTNFSGGALEAMTGRGYAGGNDLYVSGLDANDYFGTAVSLNAAGDRLAASAYIDDGFGAGSNNDNYGAAYLFSFTDGNFSGGVLEGIVGKGYVGGKNINVDDLDVQDSFGRSLSLNGAGDRLAIGALNDDGFGAASTADDYGAVYLFAFSDTSFSNGAHVGTIGRGYSGPGDVDIALDPVDRFGIGVALNAAGDRLAAGAAYDDGSGASGGLDYGAVHLFTFADGDFGAGEHVGTIGVDYIDPGDIDITLGTADYFGASVSLNAVGDRLASGAYLAANATGTIANAGTVSLFTFADADFGGGALAATIGSGYAGGKNVNVALDLNDGFGTGVALNAAGDRLAVGAWLDDGFGVAGGSNDYGAVHLFSFTDGDFSGGARTVSLGRGYDAGGGANAPLEIGDAFGISVALNGAGDRMAVGAHYDDGAGLAPAANTNYGAVYLFSAATLTGPRLPSVGYGDFPGQTITVNASDIAAMLAQGSAVTLQASNDITVANAITVPGGSSVVAGDLTLQAGRSLQVNANVVTSGGDVRLVGNDLLANGVIDAERDPGAAVIDMAPGISIDAGSGAVAIELRAGADKTNSESGDIVLGAISAGTISAVNLGATAGSGIVLDPGAVLTASGAGDAIVLVGQDFINSAGSSAMSATNGRWLVWSQDPADDTRGGLDYDFKQYNAVHGVTAPAQATGDGFLYSLAPVITGGLAGTVSRIYDGSVIASLTDANYTVSGAIDGDTVLLNNPASGLYDTKNVGTGKTVTASGVSIATAENGDAIVYGYQLASTDVSGAVGEVTPATLTASLIGSVSRVYDTTTDAMLAAGNYDLSGVLGSDDVSLNDPAEGSYDSKNVGTGKAVTVNGVALVGGDADGDGFNDSDNYVLASTEVSGAIGEITPAALTASLIGSVSRVYDTTTDAMLAAGNYDLSGVLGSDSVNLNNPAAGSYDSKNVGTGKTVTVNGLALAGGDADGDGFIDANNYQLASTDLSAAIGEITPATLTASLIGAVSRVYDTTTDAMLTAGNYDLSGVLGSDDVSLNDPASGAYDSKNVGTGKTVTVNGLVLAGGDADGDGFNDANNYQLASTDLSGAIGEITPATLTASLIGSVSRVYDTTTDAMLTAGNYDLSGVLGSDDVSLNDPASGAYDSKNVGSGKTVTVNGVALLGGDADGDGFNDADNYQLASSDLSAAIGEITPATLTASLIGAVSRVYDTTTDATLAAGNYDLSGVLGSDDVSLNDPGAGSYDNKNVGTVKTVTVNGVALVGGDADGDGFNDVDNYQLASSDLSAEIGEITPATLTASLIGTVLKVYDTTTDANLGAGNYDLSSVLGSDSVNLNDPAVGSYDSKNAGTGKTVTVNGVALLGGDADGDGFNDADNYILASTNLSGAIGEITPAALTVSLIGLVSRVYDTTTDAVLTAGNYDLSGVLGSDDVSLNDPAAGSYDSKNVGTAKTVTVNGLALVGGDADGDGFNDADNYVLASTAAIGAIGEITPATLTASLVGAVSRIYDTTTDAMLTAGNYDLSTVLGTDDVGLNDPVAGAYDSKNVGTGRTVTVNGLALVGGDADGDGFNDADNYVLASTDVSGTVGEITPATLTAGLVGGVSRVYDTTTDAVLTAVNYDLSGVLGPDNVSLNDPAAGSYDSKNVGTAKTVTVNGLALVGGDADGDGFNDADNYVLASTAAIGAIGEITPATLTASLIGAVSRIYDTTIDATLAVGNYDLSGVLGSDDVSLNHPAAGTYDDKNVGTGKTVTVSGLALGGTDGGNYQLTSTDVSGAIGEITPASLTALLIGAVSRIYDTTTDATLGAANYDLSTVLGTDDVSLNNPGSGTYDDKNVGTGKSVTVSGLALTGADAGNYQLTSTDVSGAIGEITPATLTASLIGAVSRIYDTTIDATLAAGNYDLSGVLGSDDVSLDHPAGGAYDDKNVGTGKTVTVNGLALLGGDADGDSFNDASNYVLASTDVSGAIGEITPATLTASLIGAVSRVYDTTTNAVLAAGNYDLSGVLGSDDVSVNGSTAGSYDTKNVGTGKTVTVSGLALSGADAGNYQLTSTDVSGAIGEITPATLIASLIGTTSRIYDTTTGATLAAGNYDLTGVLGSDSVNLNDPTAGTYDTRNAGTGKSVTVNGLALLGGDADGDSFNDAGNYVLASTDVSGMIGQITPATLTASLIGAVSRIYDTTTDATLAAGNYDLSGVLGGDDVSLNSPASGTYDDKNVGTGKTVTVNGLALNGADAGNYQLAASTASDPVGEITPAMVAVDLTGAVSRVYDATTAAMLESGNYAVIGLITGDDVALNNPTSGTYDDKNAGTGKTVTVNGLALNGADAGNYQLSVTTVSDAVGEITPAMVAVDLTGAVSRVYDATTAAMLESGNYAVIGFITGDDVALNNPTSGTYDDKNAGAGKTVTVNGLALNGADAGNYQLVATMASDAVGEITPAALSLQLTGTVSKVYDGTTAAALLPGAYSLAGLLSGDDLELSGSGAYDSKDVGTGKAVTFSDLLLSGVDAGNYSLALTQTTGSVGEITPATLTVDVNDASRQQNQPNPGFTYTILGFVPGEDESLISGLAVTTTASTASPLGIYPIVAIGASAPNYRFVYEDGQLTVLPQLTPSDVKVRTVDHANVRNIETGSELYGCAARTNAAPQLNPAHKLDSSSCRGNALNVAVRGFPASVGAAMARNLF